MSKMNELNVDQQRRAIELVAYLAAMQDDGEEDDDGEEYEMVADDAMDTLSYLIQTSREIFGDCNEHSR